MAAPTNVRVESNSLTTATLRWSYSGSAQISVWRSLTSGSGFSEVTGIGTRVAVGTTLYIDTSLEAGTQYFYKVSDDVGSTFSSEVSVVTQSCLPPAGSLDTFSLPRIAEPESEFLDAAEATDKFNNLAERIENVLGGRVLAPDDCIVCPSNGAVVMNCGGHCREWIVIADEDINSISLQYCDEGEGNIDFLIPPNTTRRITGWPDGFGFSGDEPAIVAGANGRTMSVPSSKTGGKGKPSSSRPSTNRGIGSGSGGGGGACACQAANGALTIKSCNSNNSLNCASTKSLQLKVCGGVGPYSWSKTGDIELSKSSGVTTTVTPPANSGSGEAGTAYWIDCWMCGTCSSGTCTANAACCHGEYSCDDVWTSALPGDPSPCDRILNCGNPSAGSLSGCCNGNSNICCPGTPCVDCRTNCQSGVLTMCDQRSAGMISAGCNPCGLQAGATVTVTDALGTQTTIIVRA